MLSGVRWRIGCFLHATPGQKSQGNKDRVTNTVYSQKTKKGKASKTGDRTDEKGWENTKASYDKDRKKQAAAPISAEEQEPQPRVSVSALVTKDWQSQQQDKPTVLTSLNPVGEGR